MKYEQAFYTWGENQLSKYKTGLGICATSNMDDYFLDRCLRLGAKFSTEYTTRTSQFTLYSEEFRGFVGVGVSPRADGGDGRANKLCHFYIPVEVEDKQPHEYYLLYEYLREVEDGTIFEQVELAPQHYDYKAVLERFGFVESNPNAVSKLASLLQMVYPCAFGEKQKMLIVIDQDKHDIEENAIIARELTWLLSYLVPVPKENPMAYRKRLSYSVYTTKNVDVATLVYTNDESLGENRFYLDKEEVTEDIPTVYMELAQRAVNSVDAIQEFWDGLLSCRNSRELRSGQLSLLYLKWKLQRQEEVVIEDLRGELNNLFIQAGKTKWYRDFLVDFLLQSKLILNNDQLISFWSRFVLPEMKEYETQTVEEQRQLVQVACNILLLMHGTNEKNYELFIQDLDENIRAQVLSKLYEQDQSVVKEDMNDTTTLEKFQKTVMMYRSLKGLPAFLNNILEKAMSFYENGDNEEKTEVATIMCEVDAQLWKNNLIKKINSEMSEETLAQLATRNISQMQYSECQLAWINFVCLRIRAGEVLDEMIYKALLEERLKELLALPTNLSLEMGIGELETILWEYAGNLKTRVYYHFVKSSQRSVKVHRIWEVVSNENYAELYQIFSENPRLSSVKEQACEGSNSCEFVRKSYLVWECLYGSEARLITKSMTFGYELGRLDKAQLREEINSWKQELLMKGSQFNIADGHNFIRLDLWQMELDGAGNTVRNNKQCRKYRKLKENYSNFANFIQIDSYHYESRFERDIRDYIRPMRFYFEAYDWEVSKENVIDSAKLLQHVSGEFPGEDIVSAMMEKIESVMEKVKEGIEARMKNIQQMNERIEELKKEIAYLKDQISQEEAIKRKETELYNEVVPIYNQVEEAGKRYVHPIATEKSEKDVIDLPQAVIKNLRTATKPQQEETTTPNPESQQQSVSPISGGQQQSIPPLPEVVQQKVNVVPRINRDGIKSRYRK